MGDVVWDFKGRKESHIEKEKQMLGKQVFAGPSLTMRHREDKGQRGLARFLPVCQPNSC